MLTLESPKYKRSLLDDWKEIPCGGTVTPQPLHIKVTCYNNSSEEKSVRLRLTNESRQIIVTTNFQQIQPNEKLLVGMMIPALDSNAYYSLSFISTSGEFSNDCQFTI